jgi:hypothetical protein
MTFGKTVVSLISASILVAGLSACQRQEGPAEKAGKAIDKTVEKAGQQVEKAGEKIQDVAKGATDKAK